MGHRCVAVIHGTHSKQTSMYLQLYIPPSTPVKTVLHSTVNRLHHTVIDAIYLRLEPGAYNSLTGLLVLGPTVVSCHSYTLTGTGAREWLWNKYHTRYKSTYFTVVAS